MRLERCVTIALAVVVVILFADNASKSDVSTGIISVLRSTLGGKRMAPLVWGCRNANRGVTFTFDDGPGRYTAQLLDVLKALDVKATFFVCGNAALRQPEVIRRMVEEGHEVGSHTTSHKNLTQLMEAGNTALLDQEVIGNEDIIFNLTGKRPKYLRPPYGAVNADVLRYLGARGYDGVVMWSGGCIDWFFHDYMKELPVYINGMADAGALLCFHDNNDAENMLSHLQEFVTLLRTATPQTTINPQGRPILSMAECLGT